MSRILHETLVPFEVDGQSLPPFLCTPDSLTELAVGNLVTRGMVRVISDIRSVSRDGDGLHARLLQEGRVSLGLPERMALPVAFDGVEPPPGDRVQRMLSALSRHKGSFGTHRVAVASPQGVEVFEDVSRGNAADKAVGHAVLRRWDLKRTAVLTTGRLTLDIALKCAMAGIPAVCTIKYVSDLAQKYAEGLRMWVAGGVAGEQHEP